MMDFLFFVKTLLVCLVLTLALQVRIDELTLEQHAKNLITQSALVSPLQGVADGGAKMVRDLSKKIYQSIRKEGNVGAASGGPERGLIFAKRKGPGEKDSEALSEPESESSMHESAD